jgi:hypothetical protein
MTVPDDTPFDDSHRHSDGEVAGSASDADADVPAEGEPALPLDEEAAWLMIVENYGERPEMGPDPLPERPDRRDQSPARPVAPPVLDRSYLDALDAARTGDPVAGRHDDEHFVPPEPPPIPRGTPARRLAWCCLFGAPLLLLIGVALGRSYPMWASVCLLTAFVGGFVFLIATMPRHGGDGYDDGAVV